MYDRSALGSSRVLCLAVALLAVACTSTSTPAGPASTPQPGAPAPTQARSGAKSITIGITLAVQAMGVVGNVTTAGGWHSMDEVHSDGLITSDMTVRRPVGRLAENAPSFDEGSMTLLDDGRMRVVYILRKGVTWQDGAPFTADDLVFTYNVLSDPSFPLGHQDAIKLIDHVEATDVTTFVVEFKAPYYRGGVLGIGLFWPLPEHILGPAYDKYLADKDPNDVLNLPYWTSDYVHLGPFRLTSFDPAEVDFQAYDGYYLGRPKLDAVHVRVFSDPNTLYSNLLSGTVDYFTESTLDADLGYQLQSQWQASGAGMVMTKEGNTWFLGPQFRPEVQMEPAVLDPRVRAALYRALDRPGLSQGLNAGHAELAANSFLPPQDPTYEAAKDDMVPYSFDPARAKSELQSLGWTTAPDGSLRSATDGHQFHTQLSAVTGREQGIAAMASYWRAIGIQADEYVVPASQVRDPEARAQFPGFDSSAQGSGDAILGRLQGPPASAATHWTGDRGGYDDAQMVNLITAYRTSPELPGQIQAMKAISDYWAATLPLLVVYFLPEQTGARKGLTALDDWSGGAEPAQLWGTYTRDIYLWDLQ